jgi:hypothetical protein
MGNADNDLSYPEYKDKLQGAFLEAMMGKKWSLYNKEGWQPMMERYHAIFDNLAAPRIVAFNVAGDPHDYRFLRFALASSLMNNGYFSFTDSKKEYSSVSWFDEYDVNLGKPRSPPQTKPWRDGVYRRQFEHGLVFVNPTGERKRISVEEGYAHFRGKQAPEVNNGKPVRTLMLEAGDGVLLVKVGQKR